MDSSRPMIAMELGAVAIATATATEVANLDELVGATPNA